MVMNFVMVMMLRMMMRMIMMMMMMNVMMMMTMTVNIMIMIRNCSGDDIDEDCLTCLLFQEGKKDFERQTEKFCKSLDSYVSLSTRKKEASLQEVSFTQIYS